MNRQTISETARLVVGQRVHCILYGGRDGIITKIEGEQQPETVRQLGGRAHVTVAFDDGTLSGGLPESIIRGVQWRLYEGIATAEEVEAALQFCAAECIRRETEAKLGADKRKMRRADAIAANPHLERATADMGGHVLAARNIRRELKAAFPGIVFRVTSKSYSGGNSVSVHWHDGPTTKQVEAVTGKYQEGTFDGMTDCYDYDNENVWPDLFGGAKYVMESRSLSDANHVAACRLIAAAYGETFNDPWQRIPGAGDSLQTLVNRATYLSPLKPGEVFGKVEHRDGGLVLVP